MSIRCRVVCFSKLNSVMQFQRSSRLPACVVPLNSVMQFQRCSRLLACVVPRKLKFATPLVITETIIETHKIRLILKYGNSSPAMSKANRLPVPTADRAKRQFMNTGAFLPVFCKKKRKWENEKTTSQKERACPHQNRDES